MKYKYHSYVVMDTVHRPGGTWFSQCGHFHVVGSHVDVLTVKSCSRQLFPTSKHAVCGRNNAASTHTRDGPCSSGDPLPARLTASRSSLRCCWMSSPSRPTCPSRETSAVIVTEVVSGRRPAGPTCDASAAGPVQSTTITVRGSAASATALQSLLFATRSMTRSCEHVRTRIERSGLSERC